jgi:anti-anti-sigma factor
MLTIEKSGAGTAVIAGRLYAAHAAAVEQFLDGLDGGVILDCSRLDYVSSAGLNVLSKAQRQRTQQGTRLRLVGASRHLTDIFRLSGLDLLLNDPEQNHE